MADTKHLRWLGDYGRNTASSTENPKPANDSHSAAAANDADGWQQYRHWISKAPAPRARRTGIDPALFTWKGYRSWTEEVRRSWPEDSDNEEN
jgi:hypothetical protein